MLAKILADVILLIHSTFIAFVVAGGFFALRWRWIAFIHIPCAVWGALIEFTGWICPLTPLEIHLRIAAGEAGYHGGFIDHYLLSLIYPAGLTRQEQVFVGFIVVAINLAIYGRIAARVRRQTQSDADKPH